MANNFVHIELNTTDPEKAKSFYGQLFAGWKLEDMPMPEGAYTMIRLDPLHPGGRLGCGHGKGSVVGR